MTSTSKVISWHNCQKRFNPDGENLVYEEGRNPPLKPGKTALTRDARVKSQQGARLIMGFNVGIRPTWDVENVIKAFFKLRYEQLERAFAEGYATPNKDGGDIGASFVVQRGLWQPLIGGKTPYPEPGCQILCLNTVREKPDYFEIDMEYVAEMLATEFAQDAVIVEHQRGGKIIETVLYGPRSGGWTP